MSNKPNEKTTPAPQAGAATGGSELAVVQSAPPAQAATGPDAHHGRGGLYTMVNGVRQRVAGTQSQFEKKEAP